MENELAVGKEILSYCGKCKLALAHIIVSMKDEETTDKLECKTCKAKHKYRDPDSPTKTRTTRKPKVVSLPIEEQFKLALAEAQGDAKPYSMDGKFDKGNIIDHKTFGQGVVQSLIGDNKIQVIFEDAQKILVCAG